MGAPMPPCGDLKIEGTRFVGYLYVGLHVPLLCTSHPPFTATVGRNFKDSQKHYQESLMFKVAPFLDGDGRRLCKLGGWLKQHASSPGLSITCG